MKKTIVSGIALLLAACASAPWQPIPPESKPFKLGEFSFELKEAAGWHMNKRSGPGQVMLVKGNHPEDPYETYAIEAYLVQGKVFASDEEFLKAVKQGKPIHSEPRYKVMSDEIGFRKIQDRNCVLSQTAAEDHGKIPSFGFGTHRKPGPMMFEVVTLTCPSKASPGRFLDFSFSLRFYPGEKDPLFQDKAMAAVNGVKLDP